GIRVVQPARHGVHEGDAPRPRAGPRGRRPDVARAHPARHEAGVSLFAFALLAVLVVGSALGVLVNRNPIHAALFLVVNLASVAGLYLILRAEFLAAAQVIVYAGAIAVLFVFAIMVLIPGREETGPDPLRGQRAMAVPLVGIFLVL